MLFLKYLMLCQAVGLSGGLATASGVKDWYPTLKRPFFTPPNWLFGPVWTLLYTLMALAASRVHGDPTCQTWFGIQLTLNALWSPLFFGMRRTGLALLDIGALWLSIVFCIHLFQGVDPMAARLLYPYLAWVSFASLLNFELWRLNR